MTRQGIGTVLIGGGALTLAAAFLSEQIGERAGRPPTAIVIASYLVGGLLGLIGYVLSARGGKREGTAKDKLPSDEQGPPVP
jgi:hypothetical protein